MMFQDFQAVVMNPCFYVDSHPTDRVALCRETPGWSLNLDDPWFNEQGVLDRNSTIAIRFLRVDYVLDGTLLDGLNDSRKVKVYCTLGAPITNYLGEYILPQGATYSQFLNAIITSGPNSSYMVISVFDT
jgi:hypothetical protein